MEMETETETKVMFLQVKEHPGLPATTRRQKRYGTDSARDALEGTSPAGTLVSDSGPQR